MGDRTTATLSTVEFEVCWEFLELGELPYVLDLPSPGRTWEERRHLVDRSLAGLAARGLASAAGLDRELATAIRTLSRFRWAVDTRLRIDRPLRGRGAVARDQAVLAVIDGEAVTLWTMPDHCLLDQLSALTGDAPTPRVNSVSVRADLLDSATSAVGPSGGIHGLADKLIALGERPSNARALAMACTDIQGLGQFSAVVTDQSGQQRAVDRVIGFHNALRGQFLQLRHDGWVTITAGGHDQLVSRLNALVQAG